MPLIATSKKSHQPKNRPLNEQRFSEQNKYAQSSASLSSNVIGKYRDDRLSEGKSKSTVRLELAMLGHLYNVAIREWQVGVLANPVQNIKKPAPDRGRDRRAARW